jgi:uncharacterized membrane protein
MLAAIDLYNISVFLHVSAVVVGFGATFALAVGFPLALRLDARHLPYVHQLSLAINQRVGGPAVLVILATGIFQTIDGPWSFGDFWISATILLLIALGALQGAYFMPTDRRLAGQAERELGASGALSDDYQRQAQREGMIGALAGVLILAAIFLMVTKPGA